MIVLFLLIFFSTGFFEEILCRSFVTTFLIQRWGSSKTGIYRAVIISSILFGAVHIINFLMGRYSILAAGTEAIYAVFLGVFFSACMLRNHSIWPVIIMHSIVNACGSLSEIAVGGSFGQYFEPSPADAISNLLLLLPLLIYGFFILRKVRPIDESLNSAYGIKTMTGTID
jgi:membrane protease YdiL (CAAX protease family)